MDDEKPHDECGVFAVYGSPSNAARVAFFALYALNHRGQESAGIATYDNGIHVHKAMGLVSQVFMESDIANLKGNAAIGHTRYSTAGGSKLAGAQPFVLETDLGQLAIAHNGQVAKAKAMRRIVLGRGTGLFTSSDSEVIAQMLATPHAQEKELESVSSRWVARMAAFVQECEGAYSFVALTKEGVYGVRDRLGLRPLCIGINRELDNSVSHVLASESCALGTIGADLLREVAPGEIVHVSAEGVTSHQAISHSSPLWRKPAFCVFEYVYFARPDSVIEGQMVHTVRTRLGAQLARESPAPDADIVSGVPDSSIAAAIGYATESKLPFTEVFCKNRYIGRTFIKPDDSLRKNAIQLKYNALSHVLAGKSVVLVDDSLVRGNTLQKLVPLLRKGGARAVHIRISSPPIKHPCYMGVDIGTYEELVAYKLNTEGVRTYIGADSLGYLSHEGMMAAVNAGISKDPQEVGHCSACFTGDYPLEHDEAAKAGCW